VKALRRHRLCLVLLASSAAKFTASVDGNEDAILYVANKDYLRCQTVDDAIPANDLVVGIHPMPGMFLNVRAAAGTYTKGQPFLHRQRSGQSRSWRVHPRYVEEDKAYTAAAGDLLRVVSSKEH
jgi:ribosomal protein S2